MISNYPDISFLDLKQGKQYFYKPKEDITPFEVANLLELFTYTSIYYKDKPIEWKLYLEKKNLMRHFEERMIGE